MQSDRFAREIVAILAQSNAARSRRLMRNSLGGRPPHADRAHQETRTTLSSIDTQGVRSPHHDNVEPE
jgi:hypothetical protein